MASSGKLLILRVSAARRSPVRLAKLSLLDCDPSRRPADHGGQVWHLGGDTNIENCHMLTLSSIADFSVTEGLRSANLLLEF